MPIPLVHAMQQKVQKAALPEGDRNLPQGGLIYFSYRGKSDGPFPMADVHRENVRLAWTAARAPKRAAPAAKRRR